MAKQQRPHHGTAERAGGLPESRSELRRLVRSLQARAVEHPADVEVRVTLGRLFLRIDQRRAAADWLLSAARMLAEQGAVARAAALGRELLHVVPHDQRAQRLVAGLSVPGFGEMGRVAVPLASAGVRAADELISVHSLEEVGAETAPGAEPVDLLRDLPGIPLLGDLAEEELAAFLRQGRLRRERAGEWLFQAGEPARELALLVEGEVSVGRVLPNGQMDEFFRLGPGGLFGASAYFCGQRHTLSAIALRGAAYRAFPREGITKLAERHAGVDRRLRAIAQERILRHFLGATPLFRELKPQLREAVAARFVARGYQRGEALVALDDRAARLFLVLRGGVQVEEVGTTGECATLGWLGAGEFFGLLPATDAAVRCRATASTTTECAVLGSRALDELLALHPGFDDLPRTLAEVDMLLGQAVFHGRTGLPPVTRSIL